MTQAIDTFRGEYAFLSNFYEAPVYLDGVLYPTTENAFQAAKTLNPLERQRFVSCTPAESKKLGRIVTLRLDWEDAKIGIMEKLLMQKFQDLTLQDKLLATGNAELIEGNTWGDRFWGMTKDEEYDHLKGDWVGQNHLGKLLMQVRDFYYTRRMLLEIQETLEFFEDFAGEVDDAANARATAALKRLREYTI